jgi:hypothetical protein
MVGRGEVADAGAGDGGGFVRRHHVVPFRRHRPSPVSGAAAAGAPHGRAGEERGARRGRAERAVWKWCSKRRNVESAAGRLVEVKLGRSALFPFIQSRLPFLKKKNSLGCPNLILSQFFF